MSQPPCRRSTIISLRGREQRYSAPGKPRQASKICCISVTWGRSPGSTSRGTAAEWAGEFGTSPPACLFLIKAHSIIDIIAHACYMGASLTFSRASGGTALPWYNLPGVASLRRMPRRSVSSQHPTVNREVRTTWRRKPSGSPNMPPPFDMRICRRGGRAASEGVHHRHGGGGHLRQRVAVEPHRHRLCRAHRARRHDAASSAATGRAVQAPAAALANGALAHAFELDSLTRPGAGAHPGATVLPPALAIAQQARRQRRPGADRRLRRRQRGDDPDRPRHRAHQRGARLSRAGHHRAVRRGGRLPVICWGSTPAAMTNALGIAGSLAGGLLEFAQRRWRHGEAAASRARLGGRRPRRQPGRRRLRRAAHRASKASSGFSGCSAPKLDEAELTRGLGRGVSSSRPRCLKRYPVPRDRARRGQGGARSAGRARLLPARDVEAITVTGNRAHDRAPQHPGARRSDAGAIQHPVLRRAGAPPRGARSRIL